jgi:hypothetical protein
MAPKFWANEEQLIFLRGNLDRFIESQKHKTLDKFWPAIHADWFKAWPETGTEEGASLTPEEINRAREALQARKQVGHAHL